MPRADAQDSIQRCDPIGRITQGSGANFRRGQVICSGTTLAELQNVEFLCFSSATIIPLTGNAVEIDADTCHRQSVHQPRVEDRCNQVGIARLLCFIPKGPNEQFLVIEPDALTVSTRPAIRITGSGLEWERTAAANVTQLAYPTEESPLTVGNAYEVVVVAHKDTETHLASKVINVRRGETISLRLKQRKPNRMDG